MFKKGQWVRSSDRIGKVKSVYEKENAIDVVLYNRKGERIGRESPALDGPTDFEPFCDMNNWTPIEEPDFPLSQTAFVEDVTIALTN